MVSIVTSFNGYHESQGSIASLIDGLDGVANFLNNAAAKKSQMRKLAGYTVLAGVLGAIVGAGIDITALFGVGLLLILGGIVVLIYSLFGGQTFSQHRWRLDVAKQRLAMIQEDAKADAQFSMHVTLAAVRKLLSDEKIPQHKKKGKQQFYEESWLTIEGPLRDGTSLSDEIKELTRTRSYTNARGKSKSKTRTQYLTAIRFSYPKKVYGDATGPAKGLPDPVRVPRHVSLRAVRVTEKAILLKAMAQSKDDLVQTLGALSMAAYRILNLARQVAASQPGNTKGEAK